MRKSMACLCLFVLGGCATPEKPVSVDGASTQAKPVPRVTVRFHLASGKPVEGYRELTDRQDRLVYVAPDSVMSELDIVSASVVEDRAGRPAIGVRLSEAAGKRLEQVTGAHIGEQLAILIDGEVLTVANIRAKLGKMVLITGPFTPERAKKIAEGLGGR